MTHRYIKSEVCSIARLMCPAPVWMAGFSVAGLFSFEGGFLSLQPDAHCKSCVHLLQVPDHPRYPSGSAVSVPMGSLLKLGVNDEQ
jgi:hypothetical protein